MSLEGQPEGVRQFLGQSRHRDSGSARQRPEGLAGDVTLEAADDVPLRFALGQAAVHVGDGAWFVLAEAGDHDPPDARCWRAGRRRS